MMDNLFALWAIFLIILFHSVVAVFIILIVKFCEYHHKPIKRFGNFFFGDGLFNYLRGLLK